MEPIRTYNHGKFFGPSFTYTGFALMAAGIFAIGYSVTGLILFIPGFFIAFTYSGTIVDTVNKKIKPYTSLFGLFKTGKWIDATQYTRFSIVKSTETYTLYSRANVGFDHNTSFIKLLLTNSDGSRKIVINKYGSFEEAQKEMEELSKVIFQEE